MAEGLRYGVHATNVADLPESKLEFNEQLFVFG
jgi:hypothetical protein